MPAPMPAPVDFDDRGNDNSVVDHGLDLVVHPCRFATGLPIAQNQNSRQSRYSRFAATRTKRSLMTICPIAVISSCKKCPAFKACPLKGVIGDYQKQDDSKNQAADRPSQKSDS